MAKHKHKVSELEGALLDAAVGMALGEFGPGVRRPVAKPYSTNWAVGGPIIERYPHLLPYETPPHRRHLGAFSSRTPAGFEYSGPLPLVAAMRACVASNLGDEVDL